MSATYDECPYQYKPDTGLVQEDLTRYTLEGKEIGSIIRSGKDVMAALCGPVEGRPMVAALLILLEACRDRLKDSDALNDVAAEALAYLDMTRIPF